MLELLNVPLLVGGLGLFIHAIGELSAHLREAFTDEASAIVKKYTRHLVATVVIGTLITIILGSSSAAIILTIVFINAGALDFRHAMGLILGANIGTTFSSQLIALDIAAYSYLAIVVGLAISMTAKNDRWRLGGQVALYLGLLFFGLLLMETSVAGLEESAGFKEWIAKLDNPYRGAATGGLITLIIQSSSATVGLAIVLGKQELISVAGGLAVMLGAELGTCSDTLIATIGGSREALKAGIFHLAFNFFTILLGLLLFGPFVKAVDWISTGQGIDNHIANGHLLFNVGGVLVFLPFAQLAVTAFDRVLPTRRNEAVG